MEEKKNYGVILTTYSKEKDQYSIHVEQIPEKGTIEKVEVLAVFWDETEASHYIDEYFKRLFKRAN